MKRIVDAYGFKELGFLGISPLCLKDPLFSPLKICCTSVFSLPESVYKAAR